ncbi:hypothetical protein [Streptomyces sp. NPDC097610]|uniref:hypothetical protein n=1 Tax=Streptomyces sp. NPDC097610 TaxID=3157227 RepID=UPI003331B516
MTIPRKTKPGYHTFELEGSTSRLELSARIKVLRWRHEQSHRGPEQSGWSYGSNGSDHLDGQGGPDPHYSDGRGNSRHPSALAVTGSEHAVALGSVAAGLVAAGGGTMLTVRRRRSS